MQNAEQKLLMGSVCGNVIYKDMENPLLKEFTDIELIKLRAITIRENYEEDKQFLSEIDKEMSIRFQNILIKENSLKSNPSHSN